MKLSKLMVIVIVLMVIFASFTLLKSDGGEKQFEGYVTIGIPDGNPAGPQTLIEVKKDGEVLATTHVIENSGGYYRVMGSNSNFPTGTYSLRADDGSRFGTSSCYHTQGTTTDCDIALDTAY